MKYLEPDTYRYIAQKLRDTKRERTRYINDFIRPLKDKLDRAEFQFEIHGRPKSIHSIYRKMTRHEPQFECAACGFHGAFVTLRAVYGDRKYAQCPKCGADHAGRRP